MATLEVDDNGDGTGGVATISGAGVASSIALFRSPWTGVVGSYSWTASGTRTGNGIINVAPGDGHYLWQVTEDNGGVWSGSNVVYQPLTDAANQSVLELILDAVRLRVVSLNLAGISSGSVQTKWTFRMLRDVDPDPPCVVVCLPPSGEQYKDKMNSTDDIVYTVSVICVDAQDGDSVANIPRATLWRQRISRAFRGQRLAGAPTVFRTDHASAPVVDPGLYDKNYLISGLTLQFTSREPRGIA